MNIFPTAADARNGARNNIAIMNEVRAIELAILQAIQDGNYNVDVGMEITLDGTSGGPVSPMTNPSNYDYTNPTGISSRTYYSVLFGNLDNRSLREQVIIVQQNFTDLGYQIAYLVNPVTLNTFFWRILW